MRNQIPDAAIGLTMTWIWLLAMAVGLAFFVMWRWWKSRHPPRKTEKKLGYSQSLAKRLASTAHRSGNAKKTERSSRSVGRHAARPPE